MESTALFAFCRRSNLARILAADDCPSILKEAWTDFRKRLDLRDLDSGLRQDFQNLEGHQTCSSPFKPATFDDKIREVFVATFLPTDLPAKCYFDTSSKAMRTFHHYNCHSVQYSDFLTSAKHSLIYFKDPIDNRLKPAQIRLIFQHCHLQQIIITETFVAIHTYIPASMTMDPFIHYPDFRAGIYEAEPCHEVRVIPASHIHCHANQRPWDSSFVVMRAIDRVSNYEILPSSATLIKGSSDLLDILFVPDNWQNSSFSPFARHAMFLSLISTHKLSCELST